MNAVRVFAGSQLDKIVFPIGGMGSGMFGLGGNGSLSAFSLEHRPALYNAPIVFSAVAVRSGNSPCLSRVLEGPVPDWKYFYPWDRAWDSTGMGAGSQNHCFGLPRFDAAQFHSRFPFAVVDLFESEFPVKVSLTGWSPFIPGDADATSLPAGAIEYSFENSSATELELVFSFHAKNFLSPHPNRRNVEAIPGGFILRRFADGDSDEGEMTLAAVVDDSAATTDLAWFRGGWFDALTTVWNNVQDGKAISRPPHSEGDASPGGSIYLPIKLAAGEKRIVRLLLSWYCPSSRLRECRPPDTDLAEDESSYFRPWYGRIFRNIEHISDYWKKAVSQLRAASSSFSDGFYDTDLPSEVVEAVAANLSILKSPTVLREWDGKLWAWEGCRDEYGSCPGSCTHVWNYAQAICHLFPELERGLREVEFFCSQDDAGHQNFRAALPLGPVPSEFHAAADGQLGGIVKVYREWRISGDNEWLRSLWPRVKASLDYCVATWDPDRRGLPCEGHHNTYDIEFWGFNGMSGSFYLAALKAFLLMGKALDEPVDEYLALLEAGKTRMEQELFDGEYFQQKVEWKSLRSAASVTQPGVNSPDEYSAEARALLETEGPKYQYGSGCLSDGIVGEWMAWTAGLPPAVGPEKIQSHLLAVHRHNFKSQLRKHSNPQRPAYAYGNESGLVLCSWPKGGRPALPFPYSEEVWTGVEYQVAAHLVSLGALDEGLEIVRGVRKRYDGVRRNPYAEMECGHWYARALASYSLLAAFSGARYDAVEKVLYLEPRISGDFRAFLCCSGGFGTVGVKAGEPFFEVRWGRIEISRIEYRPHLGGGGSKT